MHVAAYIWGFMHVYKYNTFHGHFHDNSHVNNVVDF